MPSSEPVVNVLLFSALAAAAAALGALPFAVRRTPRPAWIGYAYALASGLMLGAGYLLMSHGIVTTPLSVIVGAAGGVGYTYWVQRYAGTSELDPHPRAQPEYGYKIILQTTLHSSSEGIAIGIAMLTNLELGIFVALALAVHNVGEAMALSGILHELGMSPSESAGLCVVTKIGQPLLALATFALSPVLADYLPLGLGFTAGALLYLVLTELLPSSYDLASERPAALLVTISAGTVVLLETFFRWPP